MVAFNFGFRLISKTKFVKIQLTFLFSLLSISMPYLITPWFRVLFEKLIITQLVIKYPAFFMEPKGSLPCSKKPTIGPYPDPAKSSLPHQ
jgi:hypothetical protein